MPAEAGMKQASSRHQEIVKNNNFKELDFCFRGRDTFSQLKYSLIKVWYEEVKINKINMKVYRHYLNP